jgi:hypothetical protein
VSLCCRKHGCAFHASPTSNRNGPRERFPTISLRHAFERVRRPPAGAEDRLRFLTGRPVGPVAWWDASTASSGASAIFSLTSEVVLQMQLFFFGRLHLEQV